MTHPDPDPLDVTAEPRRKNVHDLLAMSDHEFAQWVRDSGAQAEAEDALPRFREQRRQSRWGCSVALVALTLACLVFWAAVLFVAVNVFAAPRNASVQPAQSGAPPERAGRLPARVASRHDGGAPLPAAASTQPAGPSPVSVPVTTAISSGIASWYHARGDQGAVPWWRPGQSPVWAVVSRFADGQTRNVTVLITGWCGCNQGQPGERLIDLSDGAFAQLAPLSVGLIEVTLEVGTAGPGLPATDTSIATSGFGMHGAPRLEMTATCRNSGHQSVWVAQTGTASLDIIQVGTMDGEFFYAYGRGVPNGPDSLYVEEHLGPSGTGPHRYGLSLAARVWTLTIDGRTVATIPDAFRTWRLRATQVMAEGDLPFGAASCSFPTGSWTYGGYGPQPPNSFSARDWRVTT